MNIAISSLYLPSGSKIGVGYQVHYLANELVRRGHKVTVFSQSGASPDSAYTVVQVPARRRLRTFGFAWDLRHYDLSTFDVFHGCGDDWFLWGKRRPRHVHTYMGSCLAEMIHARSVTEKVRMAMLALCELNVSFMIDESVSISANTRRFIPGIRHVIPCGVDMKNFFPTDKKSEVPALLFVGTMHGRKRGALLLEQFQRIIKPAVPQAEFWAVCESEVSGDGVRWFGRAPLETLTDLFRRAWVFCLPSSYEGFGVPYIEAMASGTPVVATPNLGAREVTRDGKDGVIATETNLGMAIVELLQDASRRDALRHAGLLRSKDFMWDTVASQYEAVYAPPVSAPAMPGVAA